MKIYRQIPLVIVFAGMTAWAYAQSNARADGPERSNQKFQGSVLNTTSGAGVKKEKVVVVTGVRFSYPLIQKWIDRYNEVNPDVQIIIESRGTSDPAQYDILAEVYEQDDQIKKNREYLNIGRYAILPVANSKSAFAKVYTEKGLDKELIQQIYFHDLYADESVEKKVKAPYTIYTRLQKAGVPMVFTKYFGFEQKDIKGKAIAGADEHLVKALLRDSTGVTYLPLALIYNRDSKSPIDGLTVLPVDLNGNGRISADEKFYGDLSNVIRRLEEEKPKDIHNIPIEYLHLSIDKRNTSQEAVSFLRWIIQNGQQDLADFGYLKPAADRFEKERSFFTTKGDKINN